MDDHEFDIESKRIELEREKHRLSVRKFWIVTVGLASAGIVASWVFQLYETYRQTIQGDNDFFARFVNEVVDANDDKALKLSEFFMRVSATNDGQSRWRSFRDFIQVRIEARKHAEQDKVLRAGEARAILARQEELRANFVRLSGELSTQRNDTSLIARVADAEAQIQELQGELDNKLGQVRAAQSAIEALGPQLTDHRPTTEAITVVGPSDSPWLQIAFREFDADIREVPGAESHPRIVEYLETTNLPTSLRDDTTPWNAAFVNWVMEQAGYRGTDSGLARSWLTWGLPLAEPARGCIAVFSRSSNPLTGHVGFYLGEDEGVLDVLGGNQNNAVSIGRLRRDRLLGCRWPAEANLPATLLVDR